MDSLLKELCLTDSASGREKNVRDLIISKIKGHCEYKVDALGNIIAFKKGRKTPKNKIMLDAHTDEVGVIVTGADSDGFLKFSNIGGIDTKVLLARVICFENGVKGVVGVKPIHLLDKDEAGKIPPKDELYIDIGANSKEEALSLVPPGMTGVFSVEYTEFGEHKIMSKALDDRAGCFVLIEIIRSEIEYDAWFSFSVQEEIGARGAGVSAYTINPDYAVVIEATTAADIIDVPEHRRVCELGKGAAISFMDRSTVYLPEVYSRAAETAEKNSIPYQIKTLVAGGNNAGSVHKTRAGVKTVTINIPCRYLHSPSCVCDERDIKSVRELASALITEFAND